MNELSYIKLRRISRKRKLRKQRRRALLFVLIFVFAVLGTHAAFSKQSNNSDDIKTIKVFVENGDTLWSLALKYKPSDMDTREFVEIVSRNNGIENCEIFSGEMLYVPSENS